jgi:hypothetical protein
LARRREEKNKTQRKRRRETPSPERKKHKRSAYGDSDDYSEDDRSDYETDKRVIYILLPLYYLILMAII